MNTKCALFCVAAGAAFWGWTSVFGDVVKLKDGRTLTGIVVSQDLKVVVIETPVAGGTIIHTEEIAAGDVTEIVRSSVAPAATEPMGRDYAELQRYRIDPMTSQQLIQYDAAIGKFTQFQARYPKSIYEKEVGDKLVAWKAERELVVAGKVKYLGRWVTPEDAGKLRLQKSLEDGRTLLEQGKYEQAMRQFEAVEKSGDSDHNAEPDPSELEPAEIMARASSLRATACGKWLEALQAQKQELQADMQVQQERAAAARLAMTNAQRELEGIKARQDARENYQDYYYYRRSGGTTPLMKRMGEGSSQQATITQSQVDTADAEKQMAQLRQQLKTIESRIKDVQARAPQRATPAQPNDQ